MIAEWNGTSISDVTGINIERTLPADAALPNQVISNTEMLALVKDLFVQHKIQHLYLDGSLPAAR